MTNNSYSAHRLISQAHLPYWVVPGKNHTQQGSGRRDLDQGFRSVRKEIVELIHADKGSGS